MNGYQSYSKYDGWVTAKKGGKETARGSAAGLLLAFLFTTFFGEGWIEQNEVIYVYLLGVLVGPINGFLRAVTNYVSMHWSQWMDRWLGTAIVFAMIVALPLVGCASMNPATYGRAEIKETYDREEPYFTVNPETGESVVSTAKTSRKVDAKAPAEAIQNVIGGMEEKQTSPDGSQLEFRTNIQGDSETKGQGEVILGTNQSIVEGMLGLGDLASKAFMLDMQLSAQDQEPRYFDRLLDILGGMAGGGGAP